MPTGPRRSALASTSGPASSPLPNCHWTDGGLVDLVAIGARCREVGAALVLDVTQSLGAMPFEVGAVRPDYLACATYKWLLGPYSMGFCYVAPHRHEGRPLEHNWIHRKDSEDFAGLVAYRDEYQPGARRYDVGERSNFALMPMVVAALEQIFEWGVDEIAETLGNRTAAIAQRATGLWPEFGREPPARRPFPRPALRRGGPGRVARAPRREERVCQRARRFDARDAASLGQRRRRRSPVRGAGSDPLGMDVYHVWCALKEGVSDTNFHDQTVAYCEHLKAEGLITGYRLMRRKLGWDRRSCPSST